MQLYFGVNWKEKTAEACSWIGLTETDQYYDFVNGLSAAEALGFDQISRQKMFINDANSNCN
ncbi:MAG TPA: hypothetical protein VFM70_02990 [Salinimicrobium sp.]|nr:hypothetical protein [Salinimicrobium sp.]